MRHANISIFVPHAGCHNQCSFCNQQKISGADLCAEEQEVEHAAGIALASLGEGAAQAEIAFFGGSFTAIERERMLRLLQTAYPFVRDGRIKGIRISTRPDAVDEEILTLLKAYGVTAIELGAQSMDDQVLALNRRGHTAQDVITASRLIRASGFELGLQMMTGLYASDGLKDWKTAQALIALQPDTVRIYPTIVLEGTALAQLVEKGEYEPQTLESAVTLCAKLLLQFHRAGIPVIRLGLHSGGNVEAGYISGPWHPAFRELCENEIYLANALEALDAQNISGGNAMLLVAPGTVSKMTGQKQKNLKYILEHRQIACKVKTQKSLGLYEVRAFR